MLFIWSEPNHKLIKAGNHLITKNDSELIDTNKTELEKEIKQIEQELKGTHIREDETDIERYTRYLKVISFELKLSEEREDYWWNRHENDDYAKAYLDYEENFNWELRQMQQFHQKRLEELKNK